MAGHIGSDSGVLWWLWDNAILLAKLGKAPSSEGFKWVDTLLREVSVSSRTKTCTSWTQALLKFDKWVFFQSMSVFQSNSKHIGFLDVLDQFAAEHDITVEIVLFSFISVFSICS